LLDGGDGDDNLSAAGGNDVLHGGAGKDLLAAGEGDDQLFGNDGDDVLSADDGNDSLDGGAGADQLIAGAGNDSLLGGTGADVLSGEEGNDALQGGADADKYFFAAGFGQDVLVDAEGANEILIDQSIAYDALWFHRSDDDLVMTVRGSDDRLTIDDFFAAANAASIYSVQTATHRLFLGHPDVRNFLDAMQATGPDGAPAQIPDSVAALMPRYWHEGDKATPWAEGFDLTIAEDASTGQVAIGAIDHDENIAEYRITTDALHGIATVDADGRFAYAPSLNFNGADSFKVAVIDADGQAREIEVKVGVTPVDDAPMIDGPADGPLVIDEDALLSETVTGSVVGTILAREFDGEAVVFTLTDSADQRFAISTGELLADGISISGTITVADAARLNHEDAASHSITVLVTDAAGSTDQRTFTIFVRDVNEENSLPAAYGWNVTENSAIGALIGTVVADDPDNTGTAFAEQRYAFVHADQSLHQVSEDGRYAIDALTGVVTVAVSGNFEAADPTRSYLVEARDNAGQPGFTSSRTQVTIAITDLNEANAFAGNAALALAENEGPGKLVGTVAAGDQDTPGTTFAAQRYFFWDGSQASATSTDGRFAIDALTGAITATASYDYESDVREASYVVVARDNGGTAPFFSAFQTVAISITNVNETPEVPVLQSALAFIVEGDIAGTVAARFVLADPDGTVPQLVASGNPGGLFDIVGSELRLAAAVDFETLSGFGFAIADQDADGRADIRVSMSFHADDGELQSAETAPLVFYVEDVNEAPSAIVDAGLAASFAERDRIAAGTARPAITLATLSVADPDLAGQANAQYTYAVDDARFEMVGNQLRLREGVAFDYESEDQVTVRVTATDQSVDPLSISRDFTFAVDNRDDILEGTPSADVLVGQVNRDIVTGLSGDDRLEGLTGDDDLLGGDGADTLLGGDGGDRLEGGSDDDALFGEAGNDTLLGGSGHDRLSGGDGADTIDGGEGDDTIVVDADAVVDTIGGGAGIDRLTFAHFGAGVTADLSANTANGDVVSGVEEIEGSGFADQLTGDAGANRLIGGAGDDALSGLAGSDRLEGGDGADALDGGADDDLVFGDAGNDVLAGGIGSDSLYGGDDADSLAGDAGDDRLEGGRGNDAMNAGDGDDTYIVDRRSDHDTIFNYDGTGDDIDVLGFSDTYGQITEHDLWFERQGNDLVVFVVGEDTSVRVTDWYLLTDPDSRANHRLDFLLGGEWFSRDTDVEALVDFQSNFPRPTTLGELDDLRADPVYEATVATFFGINAPPTIAGIANQSIAEDGTLQLVLTLGDDITPAAGISLQGTVVSGSELLGPAGLVVGAVGADGRVTVSLSPAAHAAGTIDLSFTATDAGGVDFTQAMRLTIDPVADTPLVTQLSAGPATSDSAIAISLGVEFPDRDGSEAHSIRIGGVPAGVSLNKGALDGASGEWVLAPADLAGLALLAPAGWWQDLDLSVRAYASEGGATAASALATTRVVINAPPTDIQSTLRVTENVANGSAIGYLAGIDPDSDTLTYTLLAGAGGRFSLDTDGLLHVADGSLLDYETATSHQITVRATDPFGQSVERTVGIAVGNANEANALPAQYAFALNENRPAGTLVGVVAATDLDAAGTAFGRQRYGFLVGGALQQVTNDGLFSIDATSGAITTLAPLDHETLASASYVVAARDNDGAAGANQAVTTVNIAVGNLNEANTLPATIELHLAENGSVGAVAGQVTAGDPDGASSTFGEQRYYFSVNGAISGTSADGRYTIEATTGIIRAARAMDRESADAVTNHVVVARDNRGEAGFNQAASTVTIIIDNVNEAPSVAGNTSPAIFAEPVAAGTVLAGFAGSDPDGDATTLHLLSNTNLFSASGANIVLASTAPTTYLGALAYANARGWGAGDIDGDGLADVKLGTIEVVANDGTLSSAVVRRDVYFEDVNAAPNAPVVSSSTLYAETGDGGTHALNSVATFSLSDPDGSQPQLVITGGNGNNWFTVSGNGITFAAGVNFTADYLRQNFGTAGGAGFSSDVDGDGLLEVVVANLTVAARDASGAFSPGVSYAVRIEDRNESPAFNASSYAYGLAESATAYTQVGQVGASDIDGPASALRYAFAGGTSRWDATLGANVSASADGRLVLNTTSGAVYVASDGVFNGQPPLDYSVIVTDRNGGAHALTATAGLHVNVIGVNDPHSLVNASGSVNEASGLEPLTPLIDLRERMLVDPENQNMRWRFANGTNVDDSGIWLLTSDGSLTLNTGSVDYEALVYYTETIEREHPITHEIYFEEVEVFDPARATRQLQVEAIDDSTGVVAGGTFTVTVNDVNEQVVVNPTPSFVEDDDDPAGVFRLSATEFYVMGEIVEGRIVALNTFDPERRSLTYSLSNVNHTDYNIRIGDADNDIDSSYPILSISSNGLITFTLPPGSGGDSDSKWQGGTRTSTLGRREHGIIYNFDVNVTDSAGLVTTIPFKIRFLRRETTTPPVVFDLDGDGLELVASVDSSVYFDMDLDGIGDRTGWVGADDAMLVLDRNGNGTVDDAREISFTDFVEGAQTDLEGLVAFDSNQDGVLDAADERFFEFRVWRDLDQDGVSDAGELLTWDQAGISSLSLGGTISDNPFVSPENLVWATTSYARGNGSTGLAGDVLLAYEGSAEISLAAPVLLDFDGDGETLVGLAASKTSFDQDGDGDKERTAWFESGDAVLAVDRNKNGVIDDISEISFIGDLEGAKTDLEGLAAYDQNKDGKIDASDIDFAALKLWFDKDSDGITDAGELRSLSEAGIASLSLTSTQDSTTGERADGSVIYGKASFVFDNGSTGTLLDTGLAYLANSTTHATAIAGQPAAESEFAFASAAFERKAKKHLVYSLDGDLAVHLRYGGGDVDARAGTVGAAASLNFAGKTYGYLDAIVLDLDGDGVETKRASKNRAAFDMNGDGSVDDTGWMSSRDGLLVVDRNGNGMIDDGSELSFLLDGPEARNTLDGLAAFDSNGDGLVSRLDLRFGELKVWVDANHDGVSQPGELTTLSDQGIASISLRSVATEDMQKLGRNVTLSTTVFTREDGSTHTAADVAFGFSPSRAPVQAAAAKVGTIADWLGRFDERPLESTLSSLPGAGTDEAANGARRLALLLQDMAAFGTEGALHDHDKRHEAARVPLDFFA
jgi:Ca2+-binding RTX toxin-like protein